MRHATAVLALALLAACGGPGEESVAVPGVAGAAKTAAALRAKRRAYDGAPPVIPHDDFKMSCVSCHKEQGISLPDVGYSPPMPHELTAGLSAVAHCRQCHVFRRTEELFQPTGFAGLRQDLRHGERLHMLAPPVMPHALFMRENCLACHTGPAAREEIRCSHPERTRCTQCHLAQATTQEFSR